jgi:hypothetical protein
MPPGSMVLLEFRDAHPYIAGMRERETTLADRLGKTVHVSPLRFRLLRLTAAYPSPGAACLEDWLVDVANARGARVVTRPHPPSACFVPPSETALSNEELVVAICQLQCLDRPQMLRLAAQLVSRDAVDIRRLVNLALRERVGVVLAELARQALRIDPVHAGWSSILETFRRERPPSEPLLHWTRLAEPIMRDGRCHAAGWKLVA